MAPIQRRSKLISLTVGYLETIVLRVAPVPPPPSTNDPETLETIVFLKDLFYNNDGMIFHSYDLQKVKLNGSYEDHR